MHKRDKRDVKQRPRVQYDFGAIQWRGGDLDKLKAHLVEQLVLIEEYPEREAQTLVRMLSRRLEIKESEVIVTDGATGALHLIAGVSQGKTSLILPPTNTEFRHALQRANHIVREEYAVKDLSKLELEGVDYLWISNPNTPDGRFFSRRSLLTLLRENPEVTVVVDLSMAAFVVEDNIKPSDIKKYPNLIVVGSFSKAYNIPGLRVGYIAAQETFIKSFHQNYTPRCVSTLGLEAARYILLHPAQFTIPIRKWLRDSLEMAEQLEKLYGIEVQYGATPYFIITLEEGTAQDLADYLLDNYEIKVATQADDLDLDVNEVRLCGLSTQKPNELLIEGITEYLKRFIPEEGEEVEA